jgi:branched-chain amino acid transport system substrate-binding protein
VKQRKELGVKAIIVAHTLSDTSAIRESPEGALGAIVVDMWMLTAKTPENAAFIKWWGEKYKHIDNGVPDARVTRTYMGTKLIFEGIKKAGSLETKKLIPAIEGNRVKGLIGDLWVRPCDHQLLMPIPVVTITSTKPPYFSSPTILPPSKIAIEESATGNPRCTGK